VGVISTAVAAIHVGWFPGYQSDGTFDGKKKRKWKRK
jgi:hypothetical protein